uniref:Pseudouridine synthase n=1 Tax=uncultured Chloroflexota bacterium TaxID=166587 RepID=H5S9A4_9CHLR|nr:ribosomal large subunit pseudouridine synthase B [uncultured Chloroflexota bacterium]
MEERLQKILSQAGIASRRAAEELIRAGRVRVNGQVASLGQKADPQRDTITVDGRRIQPAAKVYIALYKPRKVLSTLEAEPGDRRRTLQDILPISEHVYPVGRLDYESEGLILMTNDGELAQQLTHPSYGHVKLYRVLVARRPDEKQLEALRHGVVLSDGHRTLPADVRVESLAGKGAWLQIALREGRKRQIREMCTLIGLPVVRLIRIAIGPLQLGALKPGEWRYLNAEEIALLRRSIASPRPANTSLPGKRT